MRKLIAVFVFTLLLGAGLGYAQETTGAIVGMISDQEGGTLPGVTVNINDSETGLDRTTVTNAGGDFKFVALPPAGYALTATLDGFQTYKRTIRVDLGRTVKNDFVMALGAITDVIEVTGEAPLVDVTSTVTGITVNTDDLNARMPVGREATQVVLLAPSTSMGDRRFQTAYTPGQNLASIGGGSVAENAYHVNGLDITNFRNGLGSSMVPFEFVEEIQVKSGGYEAEFGRATGGVVNMVTKSGTNAIHGGLSAYFEPESLQGQEPDTFERANQIEDTENLEVNGSVGGAIVQDKLFFFGFVRYTDNYISNFRQGRGTEWNLEEPYWGGKLDWNITPSHRLEGTYLTDEANKEITLLEFDFDTRTIGGPTGAGVEERGGENYIGKYTGILSENFLVAAQYGKNEFNRFDSSTNDACPYVIDSRGGATQALGCWVNWSRGTGAIDEREAYRLDADWYIGDHSLRGGLDVQENNSIDSGGYSGGVYYRYYDNGTRFPDFDPDAQLVRIRHLERGGNFDVAQDAAYVQDSWAVTSNLTVNLGARYEEFDNSNRLGESFIKITDQWAPRVGFIWDPSGQGQQKVFGSFGRYHLPIASNTNIRASGGEFFDQVWYIYDGSALNPDSSPPGYVDCGFTLDTGCPNQGSVGELVQHQLLEDGEIPDPREVISENFDPMSQDEIILGYEQMLGTNWSAGARFVGREFNEVIEDYTVDEALVSVFGFDRGAFEYRLGNPGKEFIGWVDLNHDGELTPDENVTFTPEQLRYPPAERKYYAVELTAKRRFADNWMFQGSYTWSHTYGNYEGYVNSEIGQDDAGITQSFDLAGLMDGAYGNLPQDRRHNLKLWGAYAWDNGFQVGANAWFQSGRPINSLSVHPTDDIAAEYGAFSFFLPDDQGGALAPRGSQGETDNLWALDLMLKYDFTAGGANMNVRVDVFNLLDNDSVTYVEELSETDGGSVNPFYGQPDYYQAPLSVRVGFGVSF